jgi:hypothetical protein
MLKPWVILVVLGGVAHADGPTARFGLTGAMVDQSSPDGWVQAGPHFAVGERLGAFVGEIEYAYLGFFGANIDHRLGVTVRADLSRTYSGVCDLAYACTRGTSFFGEAGVAERFGHLTIDAQHLEPVTHNKPEAHVGFGIELENQLSPRRNGWQFGVRFAISPSDTVAGVACRGAGCTPTTSVNPRAIDTSVMFDWMYVIGR